MQKDSKYVIVRINGKQHKIVEGQELLVDKIDAKDLNPEVLLAVDGDEVKVGKPKVSGTSVKFKILNAEEKGEKITVFKYKSKSRYRKHLGFRPLYTRLLLEKITS